MNGMGIWCGLSLGRSLNPKPTPPTKEHVLAILEGLRFRSGAVVFEVFSPPPPPPSPQPQSRLQVEISTGCSKEGYLFLYMYTGIIDLQICRYSFRLSGFQMLRSRIHVGSSWNGKYKGHRCWVDMGNLGL